MLLDSLRSTQSYETATAWHSHRSRPENSSQKGAGYPGAHRALLAKNGCTVLRRGVSLPLLCRWGSAIIERYVVDALVEKASWAPSAAAQDWDTSDMLGAMGTQGRAGTPVHALSGWIKQCVRTELRAHGTEARSMVPAMVTEAQVHSSCGSWSTALGK